MAGKSRIPQRSIVGRSNTKPVRPTCSLNSSSYVSPNSIRRKKRPVSASAVVSPPVLSPPFEDPTMPSPSLTYLPPEHLSGVARPARPKSAFELRDKTARKGPLWFGNELDQSALLDKVRATPSSSAAAAARRARPQSATASLNNTNNSSGAYQRFRRAAAAEQEEDEGRYHDDDIDGFVQHDDGGGDVAYDDDEDEEFSRGERLALAAAAVARNRRGQQRQREEEEDGGEGNDGYFEGRNDGDSDRRHRLWSAPASIGRKEIAGTKYGIGERGKALVGSRMFHAGRQQSNKTNSNYHYDDETTGDFEERGGGGGGGNAFRIEGKQMNMADDHHHHQSHPSRPQQPWRTREEPLTISKNERERPKTAVGSKGVSSPSAAAAAASVKQFRKSLDCTRTGRALTDSERVELLSLFQEKNGAKFASPMLAYKSHAFGGLNGMSRKEFTRAASRLGIYAQKNDMEAIFDRVCEGQNTISFPSFIKHLWPNLSAQEDVCIGADEASFDKRRIVRPRSAGPTLMGTRSSFNDNNNNNNNNSGMFASRSFGTTVPSNNNYFQQQDKSSESFTHPLHLPPSEYVSGTRSMLRPESILGYNVEREIGDDRNKPRGRDRVVWRPNDNVIIDPADRKDLNKSGAPYHIINLSFPASAEGEIRRRERVRARRPPAPQERNPAGSQAMTSLLMERQYERPLYIPQRLTSFAQCHALEYKGNILTSIH